MFRFGPLGERVQNNGGISGQVHGSIFGIVWFGSHTSGALWPGVETSVLIAIKNCAHCFCFFYLFARTITHSHMLFKLQRLRGPGTGEICVPFSTRGISLLTSAPWFMIYVSRCLRCDTLRDYRVWFINNLNSRANFQKNKYGIT